MKRIFCYYRERAIPFFYLAVLIIGTMLLGYGCSDDDGVRTEIIIIAPKLEWTGAMPPAPVDVKVRMMVATKENSDKKYYLHIRRIKGFEYTEGYEYKLKVLITKIENPPADGHLEDFELIEIISKILHTPSE